MRPFGAILFGRIGDLVGRKNTFLVTMGIMGLSTFLVGLLPSYASIGVAAPVRWSRCGCSRGWRSAANMAGRRPMSPSMRREGKRGLYTSFIQTTATLGLFAALLVVIGIRTAIGEEAFADWGWRIPFLISIVLLGMSLWIRMQLEESPVFREMKAAGEGSKAPLTEAFGRWPNLKMVLIALVGAVAGQAVVWYTGQFYALFFLEKTLKVDGATANILIAIALATGDALLHPVRLAVGQDRAQADHHGRLRARGADLFPLVRRADRRGQSGAGAGAGERAGDGDRRSR